MSDTGAEAVELDPRSSVSQPRIFFRWYQSPDVSPIIPFVYLKTIENWYEASFVSSLLWRRQCFKFASEEAMASSASFWLRYCMLFLAVPFQEGVMGIKVRSLVVHPNLSTFHRTSVIVVR